MKIKSPEVEIGPKATYGGTSEVDRDHRMWTGNDEHGDIKNIIKRTTGENKAQKSGILHEFPGLIVISLPASPQHLVKATIRGKPHIGFSFNPRRIFGSNIIRGVVL